MRHLREALEIHDELNPKLFDLDNKLKPQVLEAFKNIVEEFANHLDEEGIPLDIIDVWLVGSNASYNYSNSSDIDLHIQVDLADASTEPDLLSILYNYVKSDFNKDYDITVKGLPVELYVEDINTSAITNGIYSIGLDDWIKFPKKIELPSKDILTNSKGFEDRIKHYLSLQDSDIEKFINDLYLLRKTSLNNEGEFGEGNLIFKEFRNRGYLDSLKDRLKQIKSKELTLEKLGG